MVGHMIMTTMVDVVLQDSIHTTHTHIITYFVKFSTRFRMHLSKAREYVACDRLSVAEHLVLTF